MALKIIKAEQPIEVSNLTICLYAQPGLGKTSTAFTAKKPLLFDFDKGAYRSQFRKDVVDIQEWADVESVTEQDLKPYDTIVIDTAGRALDALQAHLIKGNSKFKGYGGQLSLQGFGALKASFISWLKLLNSFGKDVILLAHMDEQKSGEDIVERLDIQGGSKNEIYKVADVMGRIKINDKRDRILDFNPSASGFGKNPAQLEIIIIPNFVEAPNFLEDVITQIKNKLNEKSEQAKAENERLEKLKTHLHTLNDVDEFNSQLEKMKQAKPLDKKILIDVAKSKGLVFNKENKLFEVTA